MAGSGRGNDALYGLMACALWLPAHVGAAQLLGGVELLVGDNAVAIGQVHLFGDQHQRAAVVPPIMIPTERRFLKSMPSPRVSVSLERKKPDAFRVRHKVPKEGRISTSLFR